MSDQIELIRDSTDSPTRIAQRLTSRTMQGAARLFDVPIERRGGGAGTVTGTVPNHPPSSTDTKYRGPKIPKVAGSTGGFWGLLWGLVAFVTITGLIVWFCLRRRRRRSNNQTSGSSSFFWNPFRSGAHRGSRPNSTAASKRGWLHSSTTDWTAVGDDEEELYPRNAPSAKLSRANSSYSIPGRQEEHQLYSANGQFSSPSPMSSHIRDPRSPYSSSGTYSPSVPTSGAQGSSYFPSTGGEDGKTYSRTIRTNHPYDLADQHDFASSSSSLHHQSVTDLSFHVPTPQMLPPASASTSTVRLATPEPAYPQRTVEVPFDFDNEANHENVGGLDTDGVASGPDKGADPFKDPISSRELR
ncbi:hypothetical protein [Phaffia rhodozyma]|uniref:Uncharacterized protein n=1 Tax=Phaffia rhodozyma TaxID=264483 RepID=A0A0F7SG37_PHARH|nr:hypothetical protein [Phaffia rhodozyma]